MKDGDHQLFEGEDLFIYIDGGAEIYLEYGFSRVIVQDYKNDAGSRLSLEIFEMGSSDSAYGMFTFKKGPRGETIGLGDEGQLDDYYLNFCKGRYLVTITSLDQAETAGEHVLAIGRTVESRIKERAARPGLVGLLPAEGLLPLSVKYFRGPLGVSNSIPLLAKPAAGIKDGVRADYGSGLTICVFRYPDKDLAQRRLAELKAGFSADRPVKDRGVNGPVLIARDEKGRSFFAQLEEAHIAFVGGRLDLSEAGEELAGIIVNIKRPAQKR